MPESETETSVCTLNAYITTSPGKAGRARLLISLYILKICKAVTAIRRGTFAQESLLVGQIGQKITFNFSKVWAALQV